MNKRSYSTFGIHPGSHCTNSSWSWTWTPTTAPKAHSPLGTVHPLSHSSAQNLQSEQQVLTVGPLATSDLPPARPPPLPPTPRQCVPTSFSNVPGVLSFPLGPGIPRYPKGSPPHFTKVSAQVVLTRPSEPLTKDSKHPSPGYPQPSDLSTHATT